MVTAVFGSFPGGSVVKNSSANAGDAGSIPGSGWSPEGRNGNPFQYSCLENPNGQRSLPGCSPRGCKESDTTERLSAHRHTDKTASNTYTVKKFKFISRFVFKWNQSSFPSKRVDSGVVVKNRGSHTQTCTSIDLTACLNTEPTRGVLGLSRPTTRLWSPPFTNSQVTLKFTNSHGAWTTPIMNQWERARLGFSEKTLSRDLRIPPSTC